jgi:hypothetical protein
VAILKINERIAFVLPEKARISGQSLAVAADGSSAVHGAPAPADVKNWEMPRRAGHAVTFA